MCPKSHSLFFLFYRLNYTYYAWLWARSCRLRVQVLPCLRIVIFYHTFDFTHSPGLKTVSPQSHGLIFWKKNIHEWQERTFFYDAIYLFRLILAFLQQKVPKHGEGMVLSKSKCPFWTHHTQITLWIPCSFHYLRKKNWHLQNIALKYFNSCELKILSWEVNFINQTSY